MNNVKKNKKLIITVSLLLIAVAVCFILALLICKNVYSVPNGFVGSININLNNTTLTTINNEPKGTKFSNNDIEIFDFAINNEIITKNNIEIKGHGNSTWKASKKPYQIKFEEKIDMFNLGASKKWILLSNPLDYSNIFTDTAFYIAKVIGVDDVNEGVFINLTINDKYLGLYWLTHKIEIGEYYNDFDSETIIIESDSREISDFYDKKENRPFKIVDTQIEKEKATILIKNSYDKLIDAVYNKDWNLIQKLCDVDSFAKYICFNEVVKNGDAFMVGYHLYYKINTNKIYAGPLWDLDFTFYGTRGIKEMNNANGSMIYLRYSTKLFNKLYDIPEFYNLVQNIYKNTILENKELIIDHINLISNNLYFQLLLDGFMWLHFPFDNCYVKELKSWVQERLNFLKMVYLNETNLDNGIYKIFTKDGNCLGQFKIINNNDNYFSLFLFDTDYVLSLPNFTIEEDINTKWAYYSVNDNSYNQEWRFFSQGKYYYILLKKGGFALEYNNGLKINYMKDAENQLFRIEKIGQL